MGNTLESGRRGGWIINEDGVGIKMSWLEILEEKSKRGVYSGLESTSSFYMIFSKSSNIGFRNSNFSKRPLKQINNLPKSGANDFTFSP